MEFRGFEIKKSGKMYKVTYAGGVAYGNRVYSVDAAKALILSRGRVMTRKEHALVHGSDASQPATAAQAESEELVASGVVEGII